MYNLNVSCTLYPLYCLLKFFISTYYTQNEFHYGTFINVYNLFWFYLKCIAGEKSTELFIYIYMKKSNLFRYIYGSLYTLSPQIVRSVVLDCLLYIWFEYYLLHQWFKEPWCEYCRLSILQFFVEHTLSLFICLISRKK